MRVVRSSESLKQQTGQGDAHVFAPFDNSGVLNAIMSNKQDEARRRALKAQQEEDKKKELLEYYKYKGPEILDQHYVPTIQNKTQDFLNDVTEAYTKQGGLTDEDRLRLAQKRNQIEYESQKRNGLKKQLDQDIQNIEKFPEYFDKEKIKAERIAKYHPEADESGNVDISKINPDAQPENLGQYVKQPNLYKALTSDLQKQIEAGEYKLGDDIQGKETGSLFWKPEVVNGKPSGRRIPGVSDQTVDFYMQNQDVFMSADHSVSEKIKSDAESIKNSGDPREIEAIEQELSQDKDILIRDHVKRQLENVNELTVKRSMRKYPGSGDGNEDDVTLDHQFDVEDNYNLNGKGNDSSKTVTPSWSPHSIRIGGKKKDASFYVNPKNMYDPNTNSSVTDENGDALVGDREVVINRLKYMPYDKKTGKYLTGTKKEVLNHAGEVGYKWVGEGVLLGKDEDDKKSERAIFIPADQIKGDLKEKRGVDLDSRTIKQYSDLELIQQIKGNYPNATAEERLQILKRLKGQ